MKKHKGIEEIKIIGYLIVLGIAIVASYYLISVFKTEITNAIAKLIK